MSKQKGCTATISHALVFLTLMPLSVEGLGCFSMEIHDNVTFHLMPQCRLDGKRAFRYSLNAGNYTCRAFGGAQLTVPRFEGDNQCNRVCAGGQYLGFGGPEPSAGRKASSHRDLDDPITAKGSAPRQWGARDYTEAGTAQDHELMCKQCPENTFSIGGGHLIHRWLPEITGRLPADVGGSGGVVDASTLQPEGRLPPEFTSTCYGFNATAFQLTNSMTEAWVEGHLCKPWKSADHGMHITSGNNRAVPKVRSELHLRLRMVRPGKVWFSYSVDVDQSPVAAEQCPWLNGNTGSVGQWQCADGAVVNTSWGCNDHGGRHLCPSNFPRMCGQPNQCAGGLAFCCSVDCAAFGGPRMCPSSGGLQVLLCHNARVRRCQPMPIRALPFKDRFYVSSQRSESWAYIDVPEGWAEIIFVYLRDGAVAGEDGARIGEVGWQGTAYADTSCNACPVGKQSVAGSDRCSSCQDGQKFDVFKSQCQDCPVNQYALPGMTSCLPRPVCTANDYAPVFSDCKAGGTRDKHFEWLTPKICQGGINLPPPHADVSCAPCQQGQHRQGAHCLNCPPGHYGSGLTGEVCKLCKAGHHAPLERHISEFAAGRLPDGFTTGCIGTCGSEGWRGRTAFLDSGAHHLAPASSWLQYTLDMKRPGGLKFLYSLSCDETLAVFKLSVDGRHAPLELTCRNSTVARLPGLPLHMPGPGGIRSAESWHHIRLAQGLHTIRWTYERIRNPHPAHATPRPPSGHPPGRRQYFPGPGGFAGPGGVLDLARIHRVVVVNVDEGEGGASSCVKCPPGHFSSGPSSHCESCPAGSLHQSRAPSPGPWPACT